jgi:hypothetical protein
MEIGGGVQIQPSRLDLNDPPTAVGGLKKQTALCVGQAGTILQLQLGGLTDF